MRLYICADGSYAGTQADAKARGKGFSLEEVPTDKEGLLEYLNGHVPRNTIRTSDWNAPAEPVNAPPARGPLDVGTGSAPTFNGAPERSLRLDATFTATEIEDFLQNRATVAQVENVFAALGTRFAEMHRLHIRNDQAKYLRAPSSVGKELCCE